MPYVQATPSEDAQEVRLLLDVTEKQSAQLYRDWHATVDVLEVSSMLALEEGWGAGIEAGTPIPPASAGVERPYNRTATA